ncbi:MAG: sensor histidine kinase [Egibacteraceae bacterium]
MATTLAHDAAPLQTFRLRMVRLAILLGWASVAVVFAGSVLPHPPPRQAVSQTAVWVLAGAAAVANGVLALLPWERLVGRRPGEAVLTAWGTALVLLVAALTFLEGGWTSDSYLLYFLVLPFVATTEGRRRQVALYTLALGGYLLAVLVAGPRPPMAVLVVRLGVLVGASGVATVLAQIVTDTAVSRARAEHEARMERILADEAHHRIKNNLQLVADLLTMEAGKADSQLGVVVDETLSRIQSVAAVHQSLAHRAVGRVSLRPVIARIATLLADRLGGGRTVTVRGDDTELEGERATWTALVVNELVTNALRHGRGAVTVEFARGDGLLELHVADEGTGPQSAEHGLGFALIHRLVEDGMAGQVSMGVYGGGWRVQVNVPIDSEETTRARADR